MSSKRSSHAHAAVPDRADNLKRIRGIGPGIEQRLHAAGVLTFEQLAGLSATEVAALVGEIAGISAELIGKKDWIGQAQALAEEKAAAAQPDSAPAQDSIDSQIVEETAAPVRQHYATFTVELLLGDERDVRRTRVRHVQGGAEDTWAGWHAPRLVDFFISRADLEVVEAKPEPTPAQLAVVEPAPAPKAAFTVRSLELLPAGSDQPGNFLTHGQPFEVHLALDLNEDATLQSQPLAYTLVVGAKDLRTRSHHSIGEVHGTLTPGDPSHLRVPGGELPHGIFRLETAVTIELPAVEGKAPERRTAFQEGQLIQVY